jgi:hypothetical protein
MVVLNLCKQTGDGSFTLTPLGACIQKAHGDWLNGISAPHGTQGWNYLFESVKTGRTGYNISRGTELCETLVANPEAGVRFNPGMAGHARSESDAILDAYDFSNIGTLAEIGGGYGG